MGKMHFAFLLSVLLMAGTISAFCIFDIVCLFEPGKPIFYMPFAEKEKPMQPAPQPEDKKEETTTPKQTPPAPSGPKSGTASLPVLPCSATYDERIKIWNDTYKGDKAHRRYNPAYYICKDDCNDLNSDMATTGTYWECGTKDCICEPRTINNVSSKKVEGENNELIQPGVEFKIPCNVIYDQPKNGFAAHGEIVLRPPAQKKMICRVEIPGYGVFVYDVKPGDNTITFAKNIPGGEYAATIKCYEIDENGRPMTNSPLLYKGEQALRCQKEISCAQGVKIGGEEFARRSYDGAEQKLWYCKNDCAEIAEKEGGDWECKNSPNFQFPEKIDCKCTCNETKWKECEQSGGTMYDGQCKCIMPGAPQPTLGVKVSDISGKMGGVFEITAQITNDGKAESEAQSAVFKVGTMQETVELPSIPVGGSTMVSVKGTCSTPTTTAYSVTLGSGQSASAKIICR